MCDRAVALARSVFYRGAGTVEFLYDEEAGAFYFIEVNTRIQVEHPVTEMITGLDLVAQMFRIAGGEKLALRQEDIAVHGHAIEVRINAEDPSQNFRPWPGQVETLAVPQGQGIRFDTMLYAGYTVPPFYDSLLGKLIVHGESRDAALATLRRALDQLTITGLPTTIPLHQALARDASVAAGQFHTKFLETWLETDFAAKAAQSEEIA
jgi:acetyl-CoA carboxylase biotin carboxylase subunit